MTISKCRASDLAIHKPAVNEKMYRIAVKILMPPISISQKSILVFLPRIYEIKTLEKLLLNEPEVIETCSICIPHSSLSNADQETAFVRASKPKIVLSTNIAESSVTISGVDCVIDFCLTKHLVATKDSTMASLEQQWASQASLRQKNDKLKDRDRKRENDGVLGTVRDERFDLLVNLHKKIRDFGSETTTTLGINEEQIDETYGINV